MSTPTLSLQDQTTEFLLYTAPNGSVKVEVLLSNETIWLTQERMAELFGVQRPAITKHLKNIFESHELQEEVVCSILEHTTEHGAIAGKTQTQVVKYYNLDAVISVGYRVNSTQAIQFRIWAAQLIKEYIIKGFAMDDERLKNGQFFGKDYFKELLDRVCSIRAGERRIYQQITDILVSGQQIGASEVATIDSLATLFSMSYLRRVGNNIFISHPLNCFMGSRLVVFTLFLRPFEKALY